METTEEAGAGNASFSTASEEKRMMDGVRMCCGKVLWRSEEM